MNDPVNGHMFGARKPCLRTFQPVCVARRPDVAFFLDVAPEVAYARKRDFPLENLRERAALYRALDAPLGCTRLDGERPREELCGESRWPSGACCVADPVSVAGGCADGASAPAARSQQPARGR